ncbi:MAG: hypothetical protein OXB92_08425 [Acidimicrobiaceae bacterium]|nr:hypothetical protein [Acidimicrobiia bacterium]MCY4493866.1 hypothetical protein [Acidimicrobiaceae bacterium]
MVVANKTRCLTRRTPLTTGRGNFDVVAACMFSIGKRRLFKFKWARDLTPWTQDNTKIGAIQLIDDTWGGSLNDLLNM